MTRTPEASAACRGGPCAAPNQMFPRALRPRRTGAEDGKMRLCEREYDNG